MRLCGWGEGMTEAISQSMRAHADAPLRGGRVRRRALSLRGGKRLLQHPVHCAPPGSCAANARSIRMEFLFFGGANRFPRAPCRQAVQGETGAHPAQSGVAPSPNDIEGRGGAFSGRGKRIRSGEGARETGRTGRNGLGGEQREAPGRQAARGRFGRGDWPARHANARGKHAARPPGRRLGRHAPHTPSAA